jgi:hypothetical protein
MAVVLEEKWPVLGRHARAAEWLGIWADLGRAPRTIDAYGRGLPEYLQVCERDGVDPLAATRAQGGRTVTTTGSNITKDITPVEAANLLAKLEDGHQVEYRCSPCLPPPVHVRQTPVNRHQSHYLQRCTDPNRWHLRCEQPNGPRWFGGDAGRVNGRVDNATPLQKDGDR